MSDQNAVLRTDVLVVGGGPVGLALANELGWRGTQCVVVDEGDGEVYFPAGEHIFSRTMEHMRRWGFADEARNLGWPSSDYRTDVVFATSVAGYELARFSVSAANTVGRHKNLVTNEFPSPERPMMQAKFKLDPLLATKAAKCESVTLLRNHRLDALHQNGERVDANVADVVGGRSIEIRASYVVGCDGARSVVRQSIGHRLEGRFALGHNYAIYFRSSGLRSLLNDTGIGQVGQIQTLASESRPYLTTVDGDTLWRCSVYVDDSADDPDARSLISAAAGTGVDIEIIRAQRWTGHEVVADSYKSGRVFLAGDAAHLRWPKGGFGANTGIGDAVDIGWKLSAVLEGWGGPDLLESYELERRPIAQRNNRWAAENWQNDQKIPCGPELESGGERGHALRALASEQILQLRAREFDTLGVQLGYRYGASSICLPDTETGSPLPLEDLPNRYTPSTLPGSRAPHFWLTDQESILDKFGRGFTLVRFDDALSVEGLLSEALTRNFPITVVDVDPKNTYASDLYHSPLVLVRPDGHVAWRGSQEPDASAQVLDIVRGWTTPNTDPKDKVSTEEGISL